MILKNPGLEKAIIYAGGTSELAALLGVSRQSVSKWRQGKNSITLTRALHLEEVTGIDRSEFLPELFGRRIRA